MEGRVYRQCGRTAFCDGKGACDFDGRFCDHFVIGVVEAGIVLIHVVCPDFCRSGGEIFFLKCFDVGPFHQFGFCVLISCYREGLCHVFGCDDVFAVVCEKVGVFHSGLNLFFGGGISRDAHFDGVVSFGSRVASVCADFRFSWHLKSCGLAVDQGLGPAQDLGVGSLYVFL